MGVVINDFQVEEQPEPTSTMGAGSPAVEAESAPPPSMPQPEDIERIVRRFQERRARIAAD